MSEENAIRIGVGAVVFRGEDVLLVRRGKPPFQGAWSIPGGGLHHGERIEAAVLREVAEETGVRIRLTSLLGVYEALPPLCESHTVMIDYVAEWVAGEPRAGDDAEAAEFVALGEAARRVSWDRTRAAIRDAASLRAAAANRL